MFLPLSFLKFSFIKNLKDGLIFHKFRQSSIQLFHLVHTHKRYAGTQSILIFTAGNGKRNSTDSKVQEFSHQFTACHAGISNGKVKPSANSRL